MLDANKINEFDLIRATQYVIEQNKEVGYNPTRFIQITNKGIAEGNLDRVISNLILNAELLKELEKIIKKNPRVATIEDLIALKDDNFGLSEDVVRQASGRAEYFDNMRILISNIK